jgi:hypothetical protein
MRGRDIQFLIFSSQAIPFARNHHVTIAMGSIGLINTAHDNIGGALFSRMSRFKGLFCV